MAAQVPSRLYRSRSQRMLAGVCGGLGEYFDVDPVLIRLLFVITAFISGVGILAYIVLWIVVPFEGDDSPRMDALKRDFDDLSGRVREYMDPPRPGSRTTTTAGEPFPAANPHVDPGSDPDEDASMASDSPSTSHPPVRYDPAFGGDPPPGTAPDADPQTPPGAPTGAPRGTPFAAPYPTRSATLPPTERRRRRQHWAGAILIILGLLILGNNLGLLRWVEPEFILPLILVGVGAWLLFGRGRRG